MRRVGNRIRRPRARRIFLRGVVSDPPPPDPPVALTGRHVVLTRASQIKSERIRWLWSQRIPLRGLTVIAGPKGLGKSSLTNAQLVAPVTRGTLAGEVNTPADVAILTAEDDWRTVVKPRLTAHNADLARVHRVEVKDEHGTAMLTLPDDVGRVETELRKLRASGRNVAMLVVDPIAAFVSATINTHADAPVRRALAPLAQMAEALDLAVVVVMHLTKDESRTLMARVGGSGAFVNAARSVLALVRDPDDPEGEQGKRRLLVHPASNWGTYAPTLAFHIESRDVITDDNFTSSVGYLVEDGESSVTVDDVQRGPDDAGGDAEEAIAAALAPGPRPSLDVKGEVAGQLACPERRSNAPASAWPNAGS